MPVLGDVALLTDGTEGVVQPVAVATVQTTDASAVELARWSGSVDSQGLYRVDVIARATGGTGWAWVQVLVLQDRAAAQVVSLISDDSAGTLVGLAASVAGVGSPEWAITVRGLAATTVDWLAQVTRMELVA